ncbi:hypothetical protein PTKIN_Ptkin16aG0033300 [Pterospermum kingtungense]
MGIEFFGENSANAFPSLEILEFKDMPKWENRKLYEVDEEARKFPRLRLVIDWCHKVVFNGFVDDSWLKRVSFSKIPNFTCAAEWLMLRSVYVESLMIDDCSELLRENNWRFLTQSMSVGELNIENSPQLVSTGADEEEEELMQL